MAKWYERANEASFKPVPGGYVFQSPSPWLFGRSRYYALTEGQKAAIMPLLMRLRTLRLVMVIMVLPLMIAGMAYMQLKIHYPAVMSAAIGSACALFFILLVPHIYLQCSLAPLVAAFPRAQQGFTWRDQFERLATAMPKVGLIAGVVCGILMVVGSILTVVDAILDGRPAERIFSSGLNSAFGVLMAAYFFWLIRLKAKLAAGGTAEHPGR